MSSGGWALRDPSVPFFRLGVAGGFSCRDRHGVSKDGAMCAPMEGTGWAPALLSRERATGWRLCHMAASTKGHRGGPPPPRAYLGGPRCVVGRPRPQGLTGIEVHGVRLLPLDVPKSHRCL